MFWLPQTRQQIIWSLFDGYITILKQELGGTKAVDLQPLFEERSVVNNHTYHSATVFDEAKISFLCYIGCLNFTKDHTKHGLLQIQALVPLLNFLNG